MATAGLGDDADRRPELQREEPYGMGRNMMPPVLLGADAARSWAVYNTTAVQTTAISHCCGRYVSRRPKRVEDCIAQLPRRAIPWPTQIGNEYRTRYDRKGDNVLGGSSAQKPHQSEIFASQDQKKECCLYRT